MRCLFCCLFFYTLFVNSIAQSREGDLMMGKTFFGGPFYFRDTAQFTHSEVLTMMKANPKAHAEFRLTKFEHEVSSIMKGLGLATAIFSSLDGHIHWVSLAESSVFFLSAVSMSNAFNQHSRNALSIYNGLPTTNIELGIRWEGVEISTGPYIPIGKELKYAYNLGWKFSLGPRIVIKKVVIIPEVTADMALNRVKSVEVNDNLISHGILLKVGYIIVAGKIKTEPYIGAGYLLGSNFLTQRSSDFTGGYFSKTIDLMSLNGAEYVLGLSLEVTRKIGAGISYQFFRPNSTLSEEAKTSVPNYNSVSKLYGNLVEFPSQKMNFDNLYLQFKK